MILLDTNVLSELMRIAPNQAVLSWMDEQTATDLFICAVTKAEIELGIALLPEGKRKDNLSVAAQKEGTSYILFVKGKFIKIFIL
jgi:predicted nucleic acid-binding protein